MKNKLKKILFCSLFLVGYLFIFDNVHAVKTLDDATSALDTVSNKTGITESSITNTGVSVVTMIFVLVGLIFFGLMVYSGVRWMTARDKADSVDKARNTMIAAVIGLIIMLAAYAITTFIQGKIITGS